MRIIIISIIISPLLLIACTNLNPAIQPVIDSPTPTLLPGTGGIMGYIRMPNPIDQRGLIVYLADTIKYGEEIGGFLDLANAPFSHVKDNGAFMVKDVTPGDYVLVVYEVVMGGKALQSDTGKLIVIHVEADKMLDLGIIDFNW